MRPLFLQERMARSAAAFVDGLPAPERRETGWMRAEAAGDPGPWRRQAVLGRSHRDAEALRDHPGPLLAPGLHEAMHAVVGALVAAPVQFLEQALRRAPLAPGQLGLGLQDRGQDRHEGPELGPGLDLALVRSEERRVGKECRSRWS